MHKLYPVIEHFYTLQGEGYWAGTPAYFIRLGGCTVGCSWCDTRYSWPLEGWNRYDIPTLLEWVQATPARHVVITGGEPTLHPLAPLLQALQEAGYFVQIETSGTYPLPEVLPNWITLSPKRFQPPLEAYYGASHELKVVIHARSDLLWAELQRKRCPPGLPAFLQPEAYQPDALAWILSYLKENPHWRLSLQLHRLLSIP